MKFSSIRSLALGGLIGVLLLSCAHQEIGMDTSKSGGCDYKASASDDYALALSGGGYRAMLYHVGALWRMHELGLLQKMDVISSVSGGSITSAWLGLNWEQLKTENANFESIIAVPLLEFANTKIDVVAGLKGLFLPGSISSYVKSAYQKNLYEGKMLSDLPDASQDDNPRFVILSTNLKTGKLVKFTHDCFYHYPTGKVRHPNIDIATAVAASSAFPPFLSPVKLQFQEGIVKRTGSAESGFSLYFDDVSFRNEYVLSDGGVYDNLGIEEIDEGRNRDLKYKNIFVSDAGGRFTGKSSVSSFWPLHILRVLSTIDSQVRAQRIQQVFKLVAGTADADGAFWQIGSFHPEKSGTPGADGFNARLVCLLADTSTRLSSNPRQHQELLINWGYASADKEIRSHFDELKGSDPPKGLPYPGAMTSWQRLFSNNDCENVNAEILEEAAVKYD